jgi:phosphate transport system permease protein
MKIAIRQTLDKLFTGMAGLSVLLMAAALVVILGPMFVRGGSAVFFRGTIEFRRLQFEQFGRGDASALAAEEAAVQQSRDEIYQILNQFKRGLNVEEFSAEVRRVNREFGKQLRNRDLPKQEYLRLRDAGTEIRDTLLAAMQSTDKTEASALLDKVLSHPDAKALQDTVGWRMIEIAGDYQHVAQNIDLSRREQYAAALVEIQEAISRLFGPLPGEAKPSLMKNCYGATRWDKAQTEIDRLLFVEKWAPTEPGQPLRKIRIPREEQFAGTEIATRLIPMVRNNLDEMLRPKPTIYWQYFTDNDKGGHYFGGLGPEMLGTLLLTVLSMVFAVPLGVISAAYLVECAGDNVAVRIIRTCINTLAGVPSIVFGLFGLAFFVLIFLPIFGMNPNTSIWAGALTLSLLVLPVIIRASEEAIKAVPVTYKEASLSLGASRLRTFIGVQLPAAMPGILTGVILSMSRAAGETAPILFTAAVWIGPVPTSLTEPTRTLSYSSYMMAVGDVTGAQVPHNQFGMVMTLVLLVLILNLAAIVIRSRLSRKLQGQ